MVCLLRLRGNTFRGSRFGADHTTVLEATRQMRERNVGAVLVAGGDRRLVGIFTGRDAVNRVLAEGRSAADTVMAEVMTRNPECLTPGIWQLTHCV